MDLPPASRLTIIWQRVSGISYLGNPLLVTPAISGFERLKRGERAVPEAWYLPRAEYDELFHDVLMAPPVAVTAVGVAAAAVMTQTRLFSPTKGGGAGGDGGGAAGSAAGEKRKTSNIRQSNSDRWAIVAMAVRREESKCGGAPPSGARGARGLLRPQGE